MTAETRPDITTISRGAELRRWYWLKTELVCEARRQGIKSGGAKFEVLARLAHFLDTGARDLPDSAAPRLMSRFDWHTEPLSDHTIITDNYRNTQNVRRYFQGATGAGFKFNIAFMEWVKSNSGKSLGDAVKVFRTQAKVAKTTMTDIKPHNQFNQYTRDFLKENPDAGMAEVRRVWELKRARPSEEGRHRYHCDDLNLSG